MDNTSVHYNGQRGEWSVRSADGRVVFLGCQGELEQFLDYRESQKERRKKLLQRRINRRMCKLLNWLYNKKK